jgi:hypothetical protein
VECQNFSSESSSKHSERPYWVVLQDAWSSAPGNPSLDWVSTLVDGLSHSTSNTSSSLEGSRYSWGYRTSSWGRSNSGKYLKWITTYPPSNSWRNDGMSLLMAWLRHHSVVDSHQSAWGEGFGRFEDITGCRSRLKSSLSTLESELLQALTERAQLEARLAVTKSSIIDELAVSRLLAVTCLVDVLEFKIDSLSAGLSWLARMLDGILSSLRSHLSKRCTFLMQVSWFFYHSNSAPPHSSWTVAA